jgi:Methyltransferase domain
MRSRRKYSVSQEDRGCVGRGHFSDALALARGKGFARLDLLSAGKPLPYSDQSFDIVTALDVLEHISDDAGAVSELYARYSGPAACFWSRFPRSRGSVASMTKHCGACQQE